MASIDLTVSQETVLRALTDLNRETSEPVKGERIADRVDRDPGTVRNHMQSLKALQLVRGIPGPKGGYQPTTDAFEVLDCQRLDGAVETPLRRNGETVEDLVVTDITLANVHDPEGSRATVSVEGSLDRFEGGDRVAVGPTPGAGVSVRGTITATDRSGRELVLEIESVGTEAVDVARPAAP
ncbi:Rrf2 family transcriptional regulator [Halococcoides cellulosivorans]|uniref:TrmB family transcriptional regulator n=1 Tax=Halococcoides cellulosivorans TaxID=1679096 RepID=A0A2R4X1W0_9EURY|nr:Rrf2 family transcriptional regulator [Halococcoides cellulosivorans]AWB27761.1 TrmB family transcriptional regulator [Halococcoides cellulosivorans]